MNKLQPMAADEQAVLRTAVKANSDGNRVVEVTFSVKPNFEKGTARYNLTQVFDFNGVTHEELLILAVRSLRIDVQATWRKAKDKLDADVWQDRKWTVRAMLDQTRQKKSDAHKAEAAVNKLSKAEILELLAKFS